MTPAEVIVIGSGPSGLATAAELAGLGVRTSVLEGGTRIGAVWAGRYDALEFNTNRWSSSLRGAPFPREFGMYPTRDQYVSYLEDYAARHHVTVETGVTVTGLHRDDDGRWLVSTDAGERSCRHVVVATGIYHSPKLPGWATSTPFAGRLLHAAEYRSPAQFAGQDVLVVGAGSTGMEIAHELAVGGARRVRIAIRRPPTLLLRTLGGLPADLPVPLFLRLPTRLVDAMMRGMQRVTVGDLSAHGLPLPTEGPFTRLKVDGTGTAVIDNVVLTAIRDGRIECVAAVSGLDPDGAVLADGSRADVDAIILATGYTTGLEDLVGHLGVLDGIGMPLDRTGGELAPGLRFVGYVLRPGITGYVSTIARRVSREIAADVAAELPARAR